ncbi:LOW QUALITY PROTEIN: hypothetical protein ACHAWO_010027 [Cyclotella atomus]|uniref:Uncharacterized protein n=1 Tax=Cyclotella atomus TaxID=382360 RepID=A0ABD3NV26_9STRA
MCVVALDYCCATEESEIRTRTDAQAASTNTALMKRESTLTVEKMLSCCAQRWKIVLVASVTIGLNFQYEDEHFLVCRSCHVSDTPFLSSNLRRCEQYPEEALCESVHDMRCHLIQDVIDFCCPGDTHYVTFCYCDFYAFADTVGYKSEKMAGCKRNTVTIRRFYCCTCSTSETFLSQISSAETDLFGLNLLYQNLGGNFWLNNEDRVTPNPH